MEEFKRNVTFNQINSCPSEIMERRNEITKEEWAGKTECDGKVM